MLPRMNYAEMGAAAGKVSLRKSYAPLMGSWLFAPAVATLHGTVRNICPEPHNALPPPPAVERGRELRNEYKLIAHAQHSTALSPPALQRWSVGASCAMITS
jgi:hypothetical protein